MHPKFVWALTLHLHTLRPLSYLRALEVSPAALALVTAILYRFNLSSNVCSMLPGTEETLVACEKKKNLLAYFTKAFYHFTTKFNGNVQINNKNFDITTYTIVQRKYVYAFPNKLLDPTWLAGVSSAEGVSALSGEAGVAVPESSVSSSSTTSCSSAWRESHSQQAL